MNSIAPTDTDTPNKGLICPNCGHTHFTVLDTRQVLYAIKRRRQCENCDTKTISYECWQTKLDVLSTVLGDSIVEKLLNEIQFEIHDRLKVIRQKYLK